MTQKHEIIHQETQQVGFLKKLSQRIERTSTKTLVVLGVGLTFLIGGSFLLADLIEDRFDHAQEMRYQQRALTVVTNGGVDTDDNDSDDVVVNQAQAAGTTTTSIAPVATSELDGTYTATVRDETYTLTVKGNQATLHTSELDGEQELEQVVFDLEKKVAYVDGEPETYTFDGKQLVLTEVDNELFDRDQVIFTKQ